MLAREVDRFNRLVAPELLDLQWMAIEAAVGEEGWSVATDNFWAQNWNLVRWHIVVNWQGPNLAGRMCGLI